MPEKYHAGMLLPLFWIWSDGGLYNGKLVLVQCGWTGDDLFGAASSETTVIFI